MTTERDHTLAGYEPQANEPQASPNKVEDDCSRPEGPGVPGEPVFVFGSNLAGRHGKGAALWALHHAGAIYGCGEGYQGNAYAIPTKDGRLRTLHLDEVRRHVRHFINFARSRADLMFRLTPIGCGLAGYSREQIEPMFVNAPDNVIWPPEWSEQATTAAGSTLGGRALGSSLRDTQPGGSDSNSLIQTDGAAS